MICKKITFFLFIITLSLAVRAQSIEHIIKKYIAFTGGQKEWKNITSIVASGTYNYGGMKFPFNTYSKTPNLYKFVVPFEGKYFAQAYDGKTGWKIDAFKGETKKTGLAGKEAVSMMNEADIELENPFINYKQKGHQALLEGTDTVKGAECFRVRFIKKNEDTATYFFSKKNYALVKKTAISKNPELEKTTLDVFYNNYQKVKKITIPFEEVYKSKDQTILTITIKNIGLNVSIAADEFKQ